MTTTERLCALLRERHEIGLAHYGKTLDRDDYTPEQWLAEAIQEQLDAAGYLMRLKDTITDLRNEIESLKESNAWLYSPAMAEAKMEQDAATIANLRKELEVYKLSTDILKRDVANLRDVAETLYHELNDLTPEKDCQCIPHGELCRSCKCESARIALRAWEGMK